MVENEQITQIYNDFKKIISRKNILGILLFGSVLKAMETNKSDLDICVVAPREDKHGLISYILQNINVNLKKYDIRLFSDPFRKNLSCCIAHFVRIFANYHFHFQFSFLFQLILPGR